MPQQQPKTLQDYRDEKAKLETALALPNLPEDERRWYNSAIAEIDRHITALQQQQTPKPTPPNQQSPARVAPANDTPFRGLGGDATQPIKTTIRRADAPLRHGKDIITTITADPATVSMASKSFPNQQQEPDEKYTVTAIISVGTKLVAIDWGHGRTDTLTEGETRSRFTTALRDLTVSRMVRQQRFDDMKRYTTYARAVTYYQALTLFWGEPPTPGQLEIYPLARTRQTIFTLIQESAGHAG
jgi:hypothetical protein